MFIFGCATQTKLSDYQPKSAEEKEVVQFFIDCDEAYQNENFPKYLECFNDNAQIRTRVVDAGRSHPLVSKPQYEDFLKEGGNIIMNRSDILNPTITVNGDSAIMKFQH